jgi:hypothetical protein
MRRRVSVEKKVSTAFSHEFEVIETGVAQEGVWAA